LCDILNGGACSIYDGCEKYIHNLVGKSEWKRPLVRSWYAWGDIKTDLKEIRYEGVDWIQLAQDRVQLWAVVNTVMNFRVS
jgi:hypothetical protein